MPFVWNECAAIFPSRLKSHSSALSMRKSQGSKIRHASSCSQVTGQTCYHDTKSSRTRKFDLTTMLKPRDYIPGRSARADTNDIDLAESRMEKTEYTKRNAIVIDGSKPGQVSSEYSGYKHAYQNVALPKCFACQQRYFPKDLHKCIC